MIRLHATKGSINGYKVRLLLAMLDVPYELVELDMYAGEHKREPFLTLNPFGQMPALTDGDFTIADSHACLVYIARKYDATQPLVAGRRAGRGQSRRVAVEVGKRGAPGSVDEARQDPATRRHQTSDAEIDARCDHILRIMDAQLAKRDWLALPRPDDRRYLVLRPDLDAQGIRLRYRQMAERHELARARASAAGRNRHRRQPARSRRF